MAIDPRLELLKTLRATPIVAEALVGAFPDDASLRRRPAEGEWSAVEVIGHLVDTEQHALARVRRMATEHEPALDPFDPEALAIERSHIDGRMTIERYETHVAAEEVDHLAQIARLLSG